MIWGINNKLNIMTTTTEKITAHYLDWLKNNIYLIGVGNYTGKIPHTLFNYILHVTRIKKKLIYFEISALLRR